MAVNRIAAIIAEPREEAGVDMTASKDYEARGWLEHSTILVKNATMRYAGQDPPALRNLSLHIKAGEKIGSMCS